MTLFCIGGGCDDPPHHLARFVPRAAQRLIEENPQPPFLDKVEREATVLFLDIDHDTTIWAAQLRRFIGPEAAHFLLAAHMLYRL